MRPAHASDATDTTTITGTIRRTDLFMLRLFVVGCSRRGQDLGAVDQGNRHAGGHDYALNDYALNDYALNDYALNEDGAVESMFEGPRIPRTGMPL